MDAVFLEDAALRRLLREAAVEAAAGGCLPRWSVALRKSARPAGPIARARRC